MSKTMPHDGDRVRVNKAKEKPLRWQLQGGYEPVGVLLHACPYTKQ